MKMINMFEIQANQCKSMTIHENCENLYKNQWQCMTIIQIHDHMWNTTTITIVFENLGNLITLLNYMKIYESY